MPQMSAAAPHPAPLMWRRPAGVVDLNSAVCSLPLVHGLTHGAELYGEIAEPACHV